MELRLLATTPSASLPPRGLRLTAAVAPRLLSVVLRQKHTIMYYSIQ